MLERIASKEAILFMVVLLSFNVIGVSLLCSELFVDICRFLFILFPVIFLQYRLHEFDKQAAAIREGLSTIVPLALLVSCYQSFN
jgi:hypothetical protein